MPEAPIQKISSSFDFAFNERDMLFLRKQFIHNEVKFYKIMSRIEFNICVYRDQSNAPSIPSTSDSASQISSKLSVPVSPSSSKQGTKRVPVAPKNFDYDELIITTHK
jgi:hypothetical protein